MAFSKFLVAATAIVSLVAAAPMNIPRDVTSVVTETAYTTVDVPVTLWVDENGKPIRTEVPAQAGNFAAHAPTSDLKSSALPSTTTSISVSSPTTPVAQNAAPVVPTTTAAPPPPPAPTTTTAPVVQAAVATPQSQWTPPAVTTTAAAQPVPTTTNTHSSGQSGVCQGEGSGCTGDITHYDGGLGACGWNVNTATDFQIALPVGLMGAQSNGNPYCGKSLTIKNPTTGQTVQATVGDKCMGCTGNSIDLTDALFAAIGNGCDGRCSGFQWWFN